MSVEVRAPVTGTYQFFSSGFGVQGSNAGNMAVITKRLLHRNDISSSVLGFGLSLPTGTNVSGNVDDVGYSFQNEATHIVPYLGYLRTPNDRSFFHAFLTGDVAANGNPIFASTIGQSSIELGTLTPQSLMSIDVGMGRWLYRDSQAPVVTGIASMLEFHYTTTLSDADEIGSVIDTTILEFGNRRNRSDVLNITAGIHVELGQDTSLRVAAALPITEDPDRDFDAEVVAQFIHRFGVTQTRGRYRGSGALDRLWERGVPRNAAGPGTTYFFSDAIPPRQVAPAGSVVQQRPTKELAPVVDASVKPPRSLDVQQVPRVQQASAESQSRLTPKRRTHSALQSAWRPDRNL